MNDLVKVRRALVSVSDKAGLVAMARRLAAHGITIISTGGTARTLEQAGIPVVPIDQVTQFPEMMDGRVKTLHPRVHGGLLGLRDKPEHVQAMQEHDIQPIDLVCVNLYPFEATVLRDDVTDEEAIEQIDIGGPSMIRSAAKNHRFVTVITRPEQYEQVLDEMDRNGGATTLPLRRQLAAEAFARTAAYDTAIASWMIRTGATPLPDPLLVHMPRIASLRYGENPHQAAAVYADTRCPEANVVNARQLHGKQLSFNNLYDAGAALELVKEFTRPAAAVIKHTNPCGCAVSDSLRHAFLDAYAGDPLAAFGGIVALNRAVDADTAASITEGNKFLEVIVAPEFEEPALDLLRSRWKNVRLLATGDLPGPAARDRRQMDYKRIVGGLLVQERDMAPMDPTDWKLAAGPEGDDAVRQDLHVAWVAVKHVKSNAIALVRNGAVVGVGAGQMDRVESCKLAIQKARAQGQNRALGAVAASDAFFPFRDGPDQLIAAGVRAIVQPGGSVRDEETIAACRDAGVSLYFPGRRHFRH